MTAVEATPIDPTHFGLVKMEDRKRPSPYDQHDLAPPTKKLATTANGTAKTERDADMPWQRDLETFTKDAIYRRMLEQKRELRTHQADLSRLKDKTRYHDEHLRVVNQWFTQLLDEMKIMFPGTDEPLPDSTLSSALLFTSHEQIQDHLQEFSGKIQRVISGMLSSSSNLPPDIVSLRSQLTEALAAKKAMQIERDRDRAEKDQLTEGLEAATERYMMAEKKYDRAKSTAVAKLEKQALLGAQKTSANESSIVKREDSEVNGMLENSDSVAKFEEANNKLLAVSQKQKEQIESLEAENATLSSQVSELTIKSSQMTDDDYANTDLFKLFKAQHDDVVKKLNHLEALNQQSQTELSKLQAERSTFRSDIEAEIQMVTGEKDSLLSTAETNLARIRSSRDELLADQAIKKNILDQERTFVQKSKELAEAQEMRIASLESENSRVKSKLGPEELSSTDLDNLPLESIRERHRELERKYAMLNSELLSVQTAFPKVSKVATQKLIDLAVYEEKMARMAAEKAKADQKYFAAMKTKETKDSEIRTLKAQNTKSAEVVSQLKDSEAATKTYSANLDKQLAEAREELQRMATRQRALQQQGTEHVITTEGLNGQVEELKKLVRERDTIIASAKNTSRQTEIQNEELKVFLADTKKSLESWRSKGLGDKSTEYESLRSMVLCPVCRSNFRNTVIKTCGHVLCNECVEERERSRSRKCPLCSKSFGSNDRMKITL